MTMPFKLVAWTFVATGIIGSLTNEAGCASSNPGVTEDGGPYMTTGTTMSMTVMDGGGGTTATRPGGDDSGQDEPDSGGADSSQDASDGGGADSSEHAPDAGGADSQGDAITAVDAGDPLYFSARCTSGVMWNGVTGDQNMRPGEACPTCHSNYNLAGTLYPTGHEPNDCDGVDGLTEGATVVVTDGTGNVITLYPNAAGNFYTSVTFTPPFHAKVVLGGEERAMTSAQTSGSCNTCHTQTGADGAPGRVTLPP
jgi:hypothetical protein